MNEQQCASPEDVHIRVTSNRRVVHTARHVIKCFKHCSKYVFCFELPEPCPVCNTSLLNSEILVPPFIYESPLEHAQTKQPAILVRPSRGKSLLHDYNNGDNLHCGLLDENGVVHDFDEPGLSTSDQWYNCIYVPIDYPQSEQQPVYERIQAVKSEWLKKCPRYNSQTANCFSFVLFCLKSFQLYTEMSELEFISEVVVPRTMQASRYISLYRNLVNNGGVYIQSSKDPDS